jgi:hypothetical protein
MLAPILQALTSRAAGPAATALCLVLTVLLAASWTSAARTRARLEGQVARRSQQLDSAGSYWQAQLANCQASGGVRMTGDDGAASAADQLDLPRRGADASVETIARRLVKEPPAGLDVCARMESADQAVLDSLK